MSIMSRKSKKSRLPKRTFRFEPLEARMLLNAAMDIAPVPKLIQWQGQDVLAEPDRWIVRIDDPALAGANRFEQMQTVLDSAWSTATFKAAIGDARLQGLRAIETETAPQASKWLGDDGLYTVQMPENLSAEQVIAALETIPGYQYAEPDFVLTVDWTPNDTYFGDQWALNNTGQSGGTADADIDAPEAWDVGTGYGDVVVAVIDTGIDYNHPDLAANIWTNPGEIAGNGIDDDGNGYIDDVHGYDFRNNDGDPMDDNLHGTHVAGTIGAVGNNGAGVIGVCPNVDIMALKFLNAYGRGLTSDAIQAINYATMMRTEYGVNVRLTSNSWGGAARSTFLYNSIKASGDAGMLFVAAAGNDGTDNDAHPSYPSSYDLDNIIAVAATDRNDDLASFTNWGSNYGETSVDLAAPGVDILSTFPTFMTEDMQTEGLSTNYESIGGTSMATPHVAGAAALLWSMEPTATYAEIKDYLLSTVDVLPSLEGLCVTGGRLNLEQAVSAISELPAAPVASDLLIATGLDTTLTGQVTVTDRDLEPTTCTLVDDVAHGTLVFQSDGSFSYEPDTAWTGVDKFTFTASDGRFGSNVATVTILVRNSADTLWAEKGFAALDYGIGVDWHLGQSVSVSGNTYAVGDPGHEAMPPPPAWVCVPYGRVNIYRDPLDGDGEELAWLEASDKEEMDLFGYSVSIDGNTIAVGAPWDDESYTDSGSIYIYQDTSQNFDWSSHSEVKITSPDAETEGEFGCTVSISGDTIIVGATEGHVHIFTDTSQNHDWTQYAQTSLGVSGDAVDISGNLAIVGDSDVNSNRGEAHILENTSFNWGSATVTHLTASNGAAGDSFGWAVGIEDGVAIVGAPGRDSAYVFKKSGSTWPKTAELTASDGQPGDGFGAAVAIDGNQVIVGAPGAGSGAGLGYVFADLGRGWSNAHEIEIPLPEGPCAFGWSVAIDDGSAVLGGPTLIPGYQIGTAYFYDARPDFPPGVADLCVGGYAGQVVGYDLEGDDLPLTFSLYEGPNHGQVTVNADGSFTYEEPYHGDPDPLETFEVRAVGNGVRSNVATVTLNTMPQVVAVGLSSTNQDWDAGVIDSAEWADTTVPWAGINQIVIDFDERVEGTVNDIAIYDGQQNPVSISSFAGSGTTRFTVTLAQTLASDEQYEIVLSSSGIRDMSGYHLDGEPNSGTFPSGNGSEGGDWSQSITRLFADLNGDGFVGGDDRLTINDNFGVYVSAGDRTKGDINGDGFVGGSDLDAVSANWTAGEAPTGPGTPMNFTAISVVNVDNSSQLTNKVTQDLIFTTATDFLGAELVLDLTSGSIYQSPEGSAYPPEPELIAEFSEVEFDTYLNNGTGNPSVMGGAVDLGESNTPVFDTSAISEFWAGNGTETGDLQLARITLSNTAAGTWSMWIKSEDGTKSIITGAIADGVMTITNPLPQVVAVGLSSTDANWGLGVVDSSEWANTTVPWSGIDQIVIDFDEPVWGTEYDVLVRGDDAVTISGVSGFGTDRLVVTLEDYLVSGNEYQVQASYRIHDADDNYLDGEANGGAFPSGNGYEGGDWRQLVDVLFGDFSGDGYIGGDDLNIVLNHWGETGPVGDVNCDASIDADDLDALLALWGTGDAPDGPGTPVSIDNVSFQLVDNSSVSSLEGYITQDIIFSTAGNWLSAELAMDLTWTQIYQDPDGGDLHPDPAQFSTHPSLEFDTYLSAGGYTPSASIGGGAVDLGGSASYTFGTDEINACWYWDPDSASPVTGEIQLARITLGGASGDWSLWITANDGSKSILTGTVVNGMMVVTPNDVPQVISAGVSSTAQDWEAGVIDIDSSVYHIWWIGIDQIVLDFDEAVYGSEDDVTLYDGQNNEVAISVDGFEDDELIITLNTALTSGDYRLVLSDAIMDADGHHLDGETNPYYAIPSGNGCEGTDFSLPFNVLVGGVGINTTLVGGEVLDVVLSHLGDTVTPGTIADINGDGSVDQDDLDIVLSAWGDGDVPQGLPTYGENLGLSVQSVDNSGVSALQDYVTQDLFFNTGFGDWRCAQLYIDLTGGSIYQDSHGSDVPPNPADFTSYPALEFDTYLSVNGYGESIIVGDGGAVDLGGGTSGVFGTDSISKFWYNTVAGDVGNLQLARITLSNDAEGTWAMSSAGSIITGTIVDGVMIIDV